jgi:hypothetical protein
MTDDDRADWVIVTTLLTGGLIAVLDSFNVKRRDAGSSERPRCKRAQIELIVAGYALV